MRKQYWLSNEYNFKRRVILFEDNKPVEVYECFSFEAFKFCCEAERKGYKQGYLPPRVEEALKTYKSIIDNKIEFNGDPWKIEVKNNEQE